MYVHALHAVHAFPDLRVAGGRLGDGVSYSYREDVRNNVHGSKAAAGNT